MCMFSSNDIILGIKYVIYSLNIKRYIIIFL